MRPAQRLYVRGLRTCRGRLTRAGGLGGRPPADLCGPRNRAVQRSGGAPGPRPLAAGRAAPPGPPPRRGGFEGFEGFETPSTPVVAGNGSFHAASTQRLAAAVARRPRRPTPVRRAHWPPAGHPHAPCAVLPDGAGAAPRAVAQPDASRRGRRPSRRPGRPGRPAGPARPAPPAARLVSCRASSKQARSVARSVPGGPAAWGWRCGTAARGALGWPYGRGRCWAAGLLGCWAAGLLGWPLEGTALPHDRDRAPVPARSPIPPILRHGRDAASSSALLAPCRAMPSPPCTPPLYSRRGADPSLTGDWQARRRAVEHSQRPREPGEPGAAPALPGLALALTRPGWRLSLRPGPPVCPIGPRFDDWEKERTGRSHAAGRRAPARATLVAGLR